MNNIPSQNKSTISRLHLFPDTTKIQACSSGKQLTIAGCDLNNLADQYGTPLYLYDRATLDGIVTTYKQSLAEYPIECGITYAGKAYLCTALAQWTQQHDLWVDCSSQGEMAIANAAGVSRDHLLMHGVNKSAADLKIAFPEAGTLVIDNHNELDHIVRYSQENPQGLPELWLRYRPGVEVQTHAHTLTGQDYSKFGMNRAEVVLAAQICLRNNLPLKGLHFHLGSNFHSPNPIGKAIDLVLDLVKEIKLGDDWTICPGGGWGVAYHEDELPYPSIEGYIHYIIEHLVRGCQRLELSLPRLQLEPGRSLVARAGVAIYRVGALKISGERSFVLLDGGMADNPRLALYQARYSALPINQPDREYINNVWLAGPYCESGDVLIEDLPFPDVQINDLIAIPVSGAYQLSMASNYNGAFRPAVLWLDSGKASLIQARETVQDILNRDRPLPEFTSF